MRSDAPRELAAALLFGLIGSSVHACTRLDNAQAPLAAASAKPTALDAGAQSPASANSPEPDPQTGTSIPGRSGARASAGAPASKSAAQAMQPSAADEDAGAGNRAAPNGPSAPPSAAGPADTPVKMPQLAAAEVLGRLVGPGARSTSGVQLYGTDLGYTYVHRDRLYMLFGDSMPNARYYCDTHEPFEDDALATLPLQLPMDMKLPALQLITQPGQPTAFATMHVLRDGMPLAMGLSHTAATAWSDGTRAIALIGRGELTPCAPGSTGEDGCDAAAGLTCVRGLGRCDPQVGDTVGPCGQGFPSCTIGQQCMVPADGYCVDLTSSQYAGSNATVGNAIARNAELAVQRADEPSTFDVVYTFASKKFHNPVARTVKRIGPAMRDDDYAPGNGTLLLFGRAGFVGEKGGQAQLYLLKHALPMDVRDGKLVFEPEFWTGVDASSGEPRWSRDQKDARGLAMDGQRDGNPSEPLLIPNVSGISWLGAPINKWIMLYGGDLPDQLLLDSSVAPESRGAIKVRFADHPWGPWTPMQDYFSPGKPDEVGAPYGPGGFLFHYACRDKDGATCTPSDPVRPTESYLPGCPSITPQLDIGRMYGLNIIDAYTQPSGTGLDLYWNVSTWNPYGVMLLRSHLEP